MQNVAKWGVIALTLLIPTLSFATLRQFTSSDCPALVRPKTALLVHVSWCPHCKAFLPVYKKVSDKQKYKDWIFYQMVNDKFKPVCGTAIKGVPATFKNNMNNKLMGNRPQVTLEEFLDSHQ